MKKSEDHLVMERLGKIASWSPVRPLVRIGEFLFVDLAPELPRTIQFHRGKEFYLGTFFSGFIVAFILCLIVPLIWAWKIGTLHGDSTEYRFFLDDVHNLVLYSLICPLYVGFGCVLIAEVYGGGADLRILEVRTGVKKMPPKYGVWKMATLFLFMFSVALGLSTNYILDATNIKRVGITYWFSHFPPDGNGHLNSLGIYYFLLNFSLMFFTIVSFACYMATFSSVINVARALKTDTRGTAETFTADEISARLTSFSVAWIAARLQVVMYVLNFWIWQKSDLGKVDNLMITRLLLMLIGILFTWVPREYIELQWEYYKNRHGIKEGDVDVSRPIDSRLREVAKVFDSLLVGSIIVIPFLSKFLSD